MRPRPWNIGQVRSGQVRRPTCIRHTHYTTQAGREDIFLFQQVAPTYSVESGSEYWEPWQFKCTPLHDHFHTHTHIQCHTQMYGKSSTKAATVLHILKARHTRCHTGKVNYCYYVIESQVVYFLDAIASPGTYPCQSVSEWVSGSLLVLD